ncbi:MAG: ABC transporter permease subunit [Bacteroidales bacterium]|nr:ABC transporter permease subunit [Bacteroidales bacterium]
MNKVWIIAKRELQTFFDSLMAYIMLVLFLGFSGFFTWLYGGDVFFVGQASLQSFFGIAYWTLFFFIPALTMRLIAEERKSGTIEMLLTKPVNDWQVVLGKFTATLFLILVALLLTLPYYITVSRLGSVDHGAVISGYLGLLLMSAAYISIGIFASSLSNNQIVAFLLALFIGIFFHIIFDVMAGSFTGVMGAIMSFMSMSTHFDSISRGVIDSKDLIYFFSIITIGLVSSEALITRRNV